jgi:hypothetical protein
VRAQIVVIYRCSRDGFRTYTLVGTAEMLRLEQQTTPGTVPSLPGMTFQLPGLWVCVFDHYATP